MIEVFRAWQKEHPDWQLICDIDDVESLYIGWHELPKAERMSWVVKYGHSARDAFEEFGQPKCKVPVMVLSEKLELHEISDWPAGPAMTVYQIGVH